MFRNRQSQQKPSDEMFERFRQSFPDVNSTAGEANGNISALQDSTLNQPRFGGHEDSDPTPRPGGPIEPFRFTPSLLDPNSAAFAAFANQPPGYYTPTPNGQNTAFPPQNHDLQTPNMGIAVGTPLSMVTAPPMQHPSAAEMHGYPGLQTIQPQQFQNYQPFVPPPMMNGHFPMHGFEVPASPRGSPMDMGAGVDDEMGDSNGLMSSFAPQFDDQMHMPAGMDKFRFHVTLNAPTAMIKHPNEIPVTYLNKGQAYSVSIIDTVPPPPCQVPVRYRTFVRISFQDENQRLKPSACWQLWKEGRGTNEAHQRGGKLQAVEFVDPNASTGGDDDKKRGRVDIENSSFDGFSVIWSPNPAGPHETVVQVRFNFLSTDFSHSKGVKGIPVRLCAKTEIFSSGSPRSPEEQPEICFCKVKLFRDHGAERKLANDVLHVKKTIEKLKQQANQADEPVGKKRKDSMVHLKGGPLMSESKPGKVQKHKRTWSVSSASSGAGNRNGLEDDVNVKLQGLQEMFTSTRPVSILYLRGDDLDDPDAHPVVLTGENRENGETADDSWVRRPSTASVATTNNSSFVSPSPSSLSLSSHHGEHFVNGERRDWSERFHSMSSEVSATQNQPTRVKTEGGDGLSGWIEAIGIDPSYVPPPEKVVKPVMCVYILPSANGSPMDSPYHKAVYLAERSQSCLSSSIAAKCGLTANTVIRTVRVDTRGINVLVDDDVVKEMKEGQDMKVELIETTDQMMSPPNSDWNTDVQMESEPKPVMNKGWEIRLLY